ncbi:MAG: choice-of-anchor O protein [Candidatus Promineifilaceae bacterium]
MKPKLLIILLVIAVALLTITAVLADDGELVRKSMAPKGDNAPAVPEGFIAEADHAFIDMMKFYVPMQKSDGTIEDPDATDYYNIDGDLVETRTLAKPLISVYIYGPAEEVEGIGFVGHGKREAYGAVSLDDGTTWKVTNLSESADLFSSDVVRDDIPLFDDTEGAYPGDVINVFQATAGNKTLAVWPSRYCQGGSPNYSLDTSNPEKLDAIAAEMEITLDDPSADDLYLIDMFGVGGSQGSVDYSDDKFEQNQPVKEVPFACLWAARGELVQGDDPRTGTVEESYMRWFKAERLTSGRRDVNRVEASCVAGAGCAITWQEDPEGLRGGQGEGPGEGWSGAVANSQTDVWYSYINWEHFNLVEDPQDEAGAAIITLEDYEELAVDTVNITQKPQVGIPFAVPMRVTDNAKCNVTNPQPYCNGSAISADHTDVLNPLDYGMVDMCADTVQIPTGQSGSLADVCVTEYGLPLVGNIAATRPRLGLYGYDSDKDDVTDSAFVVFEAEESKGLGAFGFTADGTACDPETVPDCIAFDEGKNVWYYSFNMELTGDNDDNYADKEDLDSLIANLGGHGNQLNQPEVNWETGEFYSVANTVDFWDFGDYNYEIWNTEIARRGSLLAQDIVKVDNNISKAKAGLIAMPAWKQGIMNQGGPADVMVRRIIIPKGWNINKGNPYAFRNMACDEWLYSRDKQSGMPENAYYPDGLCMDSAINLSGYIPDTCTDSQTGSDEDCPQVDLSQGTTFGVGDTNPILQGNQVDPNQTRVLSWHQCPADFTSVSGETLDCSTDLRTDDSTLADQSWYNPLDVSKGHRGFLDGDFVMMLYAWSPNWRLNAKGNDRYELYVRRSFDGGETWTTLPGNFKHWTNESYFGAGTVTCETFRSTETGGGGIVEPRVCNEYAAGANEQARNVTQLKSMATTTLDPRYATTGSPRGESITADPFGYGIPYPDTEDLRDPSRYFIVYETGDNDTTAEGEPEPLDLFYSRAVMFGDNYQVWSEETDLTDCYPSDPHGVLPEEDLRIGTGFCNEFDQVDAGNQSIEGSEASLEANPGGEFMYAVWAQFDTENAQGEEESDPMARRVWWIDGWISETNAWTLPGTNSSN